MGTIEELLQRKSVRVFEDKPVPVEIREQILDCTFAAPSAGNQQLYTILEIEDPQLKQQLADSCDHQPFIASAPWVLVFLADCRRWLDAYRLAGVEARDPGPADLMLACADTLIAAQNAVVAAHSFGLGSCYIGDIVENVEQVRDWLCLDEFVYPAALLVFGYPTQQQLDRKKPVRFAKEFLVHTDRYRRLTEDEQRESFASRGQDFDKTLPPFAKRKYESDFSYEMNRSTEIYLEPFLRS